MENPGAESGLTQLYSVNFVFFLLFIHYLSRHFFAHILHAKHYVRCWKRIVNKGRGHVRTEWEGCHIQAWMRGFTRNLPRWHHDLGLLASLTFLQ